MPVLTISRQLGAGGRTLGKLISEKTAFTFIDKEITELVAEKAKVSKNWVKSIEKEVGGTLHKFISSLVSKRYLDRILDDTKGYIDEEIYVDTLHEVIAQIANQGNVVILGGGGQHILRGREDTRHLLLIADKPDRIRFMEENYDLPPTQAENIVNDHDKRRLNIIRKYCKVNYDSPELYDLVLNMSKLSMDAACNLVVDLLNKYT
jgi:cytidylate kinase